MSTNQQPAWGGAAPCWGNTPPAQTWSLSDVMSEELAQQMEKEELRETQPEPQSPAIDLDTLAAMAPADDTTNNDLLLAQMLQHEFDREHDKFLDREEKQCNGSSKVQISFRNYRSLHPATHADEEEDEDVEEVWEDDLRDEPVPQFNKSGISGRGKNIVTKHDAKISGRRNASKMEQFPPEFETGDSHGMKIRLSNKVYNKLKRHSNEETKRGQKIHEKKEYSTAEMAVDAKTRLILYKLVNNGVLESVEGVVSSGKESVVFHGTGGSMNDSLVPNECAIKVFMTTLSTFKNRYQYVRGDMRFVKDEFKKQNPRKIIKIWAEKELANLKKMETAGIPCPKPVVLKKNVLLMEFLGKDQVPAPKLRHAKLSAEDMQIAYEQCIDYMRRMHQDCGLVHADLSPYNMLWHNNTLYFIDVAQAVDVMHPKAMEFLLRDCDHVCRFFKSAGVYDVKTEYELFNYVTSLSLAGEGKVFLAQLEKFEKDETKMTLDNGQEYPFEYLFEMAQKEREENRKRLEELFDASDSGDESEGDEASDEIDPAVEGKLKLGHKLTDDINEEEEEAEPLDERSSREEEDNQGNSTSPT